MTSSRGENTGNGTPNRASSPFHARTRTVRTPSSSRVPGPTESALLSTVTRQPRARSPWVSAATTVSRPPRCGSTWCATCSTRTGSDRLTRAVCRSRNRPDTSTLTPFVDARPAGIDARSRSPQLAVGLVALLALVAARGPPPGRALRDARAAGVRRPVLRPHRRRHRRGVLAQRQRRPRALRRRQRAGGDADPRLRRHRRRRRAHRDRPRRARRVRRGDPGREPSLQGDVRRRRCGCPTSTAGSSPTARGAAGEGRRAHPALPAGPRGSGAVRRLGRAHPARRRPRGHRDHDRPVAAHHRGDVRRHPGDPARHLADALEHPAQPALGLAAAPAPAPARTSTSSTRTRRCPAWPTSRRSPRRCRSC